MKRYTVGSKVKVLANASYFEQPTKDKHGKITAKLAKVKESFVGTVMAVQNGDLVTRHSVKIIDPKTEKKYFFLRMLAKDALIIV